MGGNSRGWSTQSSSSLLNHGCDGHAGATMTTSPGFLSMNSSDLLTNGVGGYAYAHRFVHGKENASCLQVDSSGRGDT